MRALVLVMLGTLAWSTAVAADQNCFAGQSSACMDFGPEALPTSVAAFQALQKKLMAAPDARMQATAGAALFVYAALVRTYDDVLGKALLVLALDPSGRSPGKVHEGATWSKANEYYIQRLADRPALVGSYAVGTDPARKYALDPTQSVTLRFRKQTQYVADPATGKTKVFVCTPGAKTCRPIQVSRDASGIWRVSGFSSFTIGF